MVEKYKPKFKISNSTYLQNKTLELRTPILSKNIVFGDCGFVYKSDTLAFALIHPAKNSFVLFAFLPGVFECEAYSCTSLKEALTFIIDLVKLDNKRGAQ